MYIYICIYICIYIYIVYICIILYISIVDEMVVSQDFPVCCWLFHENLDSMDQNPPNGPVNTIPVLHSVGQTLRRLKSNVHAAISTINSH